MPIPLAAAYVDIPWNVAGGPVPAKSTNGRVILTQSVGGQYGAMWDPCSIDITQPFDLSFRMNFGNNTCGADGMDFVLQSNNNNPGLTNNPGNHTYENIPNSLAISFDDYSNNPYGDPPYDSIGIQTGGSSQPSNAGPVACGGTGIVSGPTGCFRPQISASSLSIKDGIDHLVRFQWDPSTRNIDVTVDGSPRATWTLPASYATTIFNSNNVYFGFTAATGGSWNYHSVYMEAGTVNGSAISTGCVAATPTLASTVTPIIWPTSICGTATPIPTFTFSPTQTPYQSPTQTLTPFPTVCGATPAFVQALVVNGPGQPLASGCLGSGSPTSWPYTVPAGPGQILIVNVETSNSFAGSVTYNGIALSPLPSNSAVAITGGGNLYSYYMVNPPSGTFTLAVPGSGCSWNIAATVYKNVDTASPFGAISTNGGNNATFSDNITTTSGFSIIHDFFAYPSGPQTFGGTHGTQLFAANTSQCCDDVYGSYTSTTVPGAHSNTYTDPGGATNWTGVSVELKPVSACNTPTDTPAITPSNSPSSTFTRSPTLTNSPTLTFSLTSTLSATKTPSPTVSLTYSVTFSPTQSVTLTPSQTVTLSFTQSFTKTPTSSYTTSPTPSFSPTVSPIFTLTTTATNSPTRTTSPTSSITLTPTESASPTPSFTPTNSFSGTPTATDSASPTPTWSPSNTFSPSPTPSVTFTDSPSRTASPTFSFTPSITLTPTPTVTFSISPTSSPTPSITETPVKAPLQLSISVFNEAGELVKVVFEGQAQYLPTSLGVSGTSLLTSGSGLNIPMPGFVVKNGVQYSSLSWDLSNNTGQGVISGIYYVKAEYKDAYGKITTLNEPVQVMNTDAENTLIIFNSAGEEVRHQRLNGLVPDIIDIGLQKSSFAPLYDSNGNTANGVLTIDGKDTFGVVHSLDWDGKNDQGIPVDSGTYQIQLVHRSPKGGKTVISRSVTILASPDAVTLAGSMIGPNPFASGDFMTIKYPPSVGLNCAVEIFNVAGEVVALGSDSGGGLFTIRVGHLAAGIYICRLEKRLGSAVKARIAIKMAIVK